MPVRNQPRLPVDNFTYQRLVNDHGADTVSVAATLCIGRRGLSLMGCVHELDLIELEAHLSAAAGLLAHAYGISDESLGKAIADLEKLMLQLDTKTFESLDRLRSA